MHETICPNGKLLRRQNQPHKPPLNQPSLKNKSLNDALCQTYFLRECLNKKSITLTEFKIFNNTTFEEEMVDDKPYVSKMLDEGDCLMVRNTTIAQEEDLEREAILHTRCMIKKKVWLMINDDRTCTNVAFKPWSQSSTFQQYFIQNHTQFNSSTKEKVLLLQIKPFCH